MASLQNEQIDQSYQGLIKTANNTSAAPFPPVKLQYGDGTELPISIGDGTGIGVGDIVTLASGTRSINLDSSNLALTGVTFVDALAGTTNISNGTYEFGLGFPGAPATNVDFTNAAEVSAHQIDIKGDGTDAGKLKLYCEDAGGAHNVTLEGPAHAGGQTYTLKLPNVQSAGTQILEADSSGNLSWIDTPSGGGGAEAAYGMYGGSGMKGAIQYNGSSGGLDYKSTIATTGYSTTGINNGADWASYTIAGVQPGDTIKEIEFGTSTNNVAGDEVRVALYDVAVNADGLLYLNDKLLDVGTVDVSTYGAHNITLATPFTMPSGKVNSQVAFVFQPSAASIGLTHWVNAVWNGNGVDPAGQTPYRAMSIFVKPGNTAGQALPASIGDTSVANNVAYGAQTNSHVYVLYR